MTSGTALEQAATQYRAGRLDISFQLAVQALTTGEPHAAGQLGLLCLAEANQLEPVDPWLGLARTHGLPPVDLCRHACAGMLSMGKRTALANLSAGMPSGHPLRILALYHGACARMMAGDLEGALQDFERFRLEVKGYLPLVPFLGSDDLNVSFRHGTLVLPAASVDRRLETAAGLPSASLDFRFDRRIEADVPALYAVCADGRYIERFARTLTLALDAPGRALHIHMINGNAAADLLLATLAGEVEHLALGISRSADPHYGTATSYACTRFFVLPELLGAYGKPVIALDIDLLPREPLARLETLVLDDTFDFACYLTGRNEPASVYQASVMAWLPNPRTLAFLDSLARFCLPKLGMPVRANWLLDQAALTSVLNWQVQRGIAFRFRPLNEVLDGTLLDAVSAVASEEEKSAIKEQSAGIDGLVDANGFVHYEWSPD